MRCLLNLVRSLVHRGLELVACGAEPVCATFQEQKGHHPNHGAATNKRTSSSCASSRRACSSPCRDCAQMAPLSSLKGRTLAARHARCHVPKQDNLVIHPLPVQSAKQTEKTNNMVPKLPPALSVLGFPWRGHSVKEKLLFSSGLLANPLTQ